MVAAALMNRTLGATLGAVAALAFLIVMVITGALPKQRQFVQFEARGVMQLAPERITSVALRTGKRGAVFERTPSGGWARAGGTQLDTTLARRMSLAVQFMNTSAPVRVLAPGDDQAATLHDYGLDQPSLSIALFEGPRQIIAAHFGARNPDDYLQYVAVEGRRELYLLSRFVGQEWAAVADGALPR